MASYELYSHSPQVSGRISPRVHPGNPVTPVHSPHHSVTSSASSRTPIHTVTIHEYRRQQNTPVSQKGTPPGKTLRRKAAASALSDIERAPLGPRPRLGSGSSLRPLHFSQSAQQLTSKQPPAQHQTLPDFAFRPQSAEPRVQWGSISSISTVNSSGKVRNFNSRKRLPRPAAATAPVLFPPPRANVKSSQFHRPALPAVSNFSTENSNLSEQTTPTPSTFSLSRFPQPPHRTDPSLSPSYDAEHIGGLNALSLSTTAPATPPATPATIHYRGASFDLVNPHDSLLFHDIVTPSRDFDSSEYLPLRSSEEPLLVSSEMAPKRALYGDLDSAHANILRRPEHAFRSANHDLPLPPTPTAVSPNSSSYTSPLYSPDSVNAPSPLAVRKARSDSRFSLKQLTRTLSRKLGKSPIIDQGEELKEVRDSNISFASISMDGEYPRPLDQTYVATPQASYFPLSPMSPTTPTSPTSPQDPGVPRDEEVEMSRRHEDGRYDAGPLSSLIPDDPSTQIGRMGNSQSLEADDGAPSKPYYDDLDSIYPSSSVYTGDNQRASTYQQSLANNRQSNAFLRYESVDASGYASEYNRDSLYGYGSTSRSSRQVSRPSTQELYHRSVDQGESKTDTIGKLIDEYNSNDTGQNLVSGQEVRGAAGIVEVDDAEHQSSFEHEVTHDRGQSTRETSALSQFEFDLRRSGYYKSGDEYVSPTQTVRARRPTIVRDIGAPPREAAPLAPAFEYDEAPFIPPRPDMSGMFSNRSSHSYGDTRTLLRIPQSDAPLSSAPGQGLQPSSSYSQPEAKTLDPSSSYSQADSSHSPYTPQEALKQAEQIFEDARAKHQQDENDIPAMWVRRSSGSQLLNKRLSTQASTDVQAQADHAAATADKADWETIGRPSAECRQSLDSIADYSSSEGTRNSLGLNSNGSLPSWAKRTHSGGPSYYSHPSPLRSHPFSSSPSDAQGRLGLRSGPDSSSPPIPSSPPQSRTAPVFHFSARPGDALGRGVVEEPRAFTPWTDPYALSDKETQELLASGPNDKIMFDDEPRSPEQRMRINDGHPKFALSSSLASGMDSSPGPERENSFEKFSIVGPKGNLTGTPRGSGMNEAGSSVADNSSPGVRLSSSVGRRSFRSEYTGFYASPFPATGSVTRIDNPRPPAKPEHERSTSQETLFPGAYGLPPVQESSPLPGAKQRQSPRFSTTFKSARRASRAAVPGQTKLREMVLAPEGRETMSSQDTHFSRFLNGSGRPSTSDTNTPLRPSHPSMDIYPTPSRTIIAHQHSPHLLCPEREANAEDEARRRKLSWVLLAVFCLLPPCIILFRFWGDYIIVSLTKGRLGHCTPQSKRTALIAGIAINIGLVTAIVVPIIVLHALKAL